MVQAHKAGLAAWDAVSAIKLTYMHGMQNTTVCCHSISHACLQACCNHSFDLWHTNIQHRLTELYAAQTVQLQDS